MLSFTLGLSLYPLTGFACSRQWRGTTGKSTKTS